MLQTRPGRPLPHPRRGAFHFTGTSRSVLFAFALQWPSGEIHPHLQPGHLFQSASFITAFFTVIFGTVILPLLVALGGVPLFFASVRRKRWLMTLCIVVISLPGLLILNVIGWLIYFPMMGPLNRMGRTHATSEAVVREGVSIAAGSTVVEPREGNEDFTVTLKELITVDGMRWSGKLNANPYGELRSLDGTLAGVSNIHGIQCGPGPAHVSENRLKCVLAENTVFRGFRFAARTSLEFHKEGKDQPIQIDSGTLADPLPYGGTTWPAGVSIQPLSLTLADYQKTQQKGGEPKYISICVPKGMDVSYEGITLHGPASIEFNPGSAHSTNSCSGFEDRYMDYGSLRTADGKKHRSGELKYASTQWEWHDEEYRYEDGRYPTGADPFGMGSDN